MQTLMARQSTGRSALDDVKLMQQMRADRLQTSRAVSSPAAAPQLPSAQNYGASSAPSPHSPDHKRTANGSPDGPTKDPRAPHKWNEWTRRTTAGNETGVGGSAKPDALAKQVPQGGSEVFGGGAKLGKHRRSSSLENTWSSSSSAAAALRVSTSTALSAAAAGASVGIGEFLPGGQRPSTSVKQQQRLGTQAVAVAVAGGAGRSVLRANDSVTHRRTHSLPPDLKNANTHRQCAAPSGTVAKDVATSNGQQSPTAPVMKDGKLQRSPDFMQVAQNESNMWSKLRSKFVTKPSADSEEEDVGSALVGLFVDAEDGENAEDSSISVCFTEVGALGLQLGPSATGTAAVTAIVADSQAKFHPLLTAGLQVFSLQGARGALIDVSRMRYLDVKELVHAQTKRPLYMCFSRSPPLSLLSTTKDEQDLVSEPMNSLNHADDNPDSPSSQRTSALSAGGGDAATLEQAKKVAAAEEKQRQRAQKETAKAAKMEASAISKAARTATKAAKSAQRAKVAEAAVAARVAAKVAKAEQAAAAKAANRASKAAKLEAKARRKSERAAGKAAAARKGNREQENDDKRCKQNEQAHAENGDKGSESPTGVTRETSSPSGSFSEGDDDSSVATASGATATTGATVDGGKGGQHADTSKTTSAASLRGRRRQSGGRVLTDSCCARPRADGNEQPSKTDAIAPTAGNNGGTSLGEAMLAQTDVEGNNFGRDAYGNQLEDSYNGSNTNGIADGDDSLPYVLPDGWEMATSRSTGEVYYVNDVTGESTFERPLVAASATMDSNTERPLPEVWEAATSQSTGQVYYINSVTGESTYDDPREDSGGYSYVENGMVYWDGDVDRGSGGDGSGDVDGSPLPVGWNMATSERGDTYYWHDETGETTYDRPTQHLVELARDNKA